MPEIPEPAISGTEGQIPSKVAEYPDAFDAPEERPFLLSFAQYNNGLCQIEELQKNQGKKAVKILKTIGNELYSMKDFQKKGVDCLPIYYDHEYKKLFSKLGPDIELKEAKLQDTGRIFYFVHESDKIVYVVAITNRHYETTQVRR